MKILKEPAIEFLLRKTFREEVEDFYNNNTTEHTLEGTMNNFEDQYHKWLLYHSFISQDEFNFLQINIVEPEW